MMLSVTLFSGGPFGTLPFRYLFSGEQPGGKKMQKNVKYKDSCHSTGNIYIIVIIKLKLSRCDQASEFWYI